MVCRTDMYVRFRDFKSPVHNQQLANRLFMRDLLRPSHRHKKHYANTAMSLASQADPALCGSYLVAKTLVAQGS